MKRIVKTLLLMLACPLGIVLRQTPLFSQSANLLAEKAGSDSVAQDFSDEETYYHIGLLRLQRWFRKNANLISDPAISTEIARQLREAANLAAAGDFYMANILLETVWELVEATQEPGVRDSVVTADPIASDGAGDVPQEKIHWSKAVLSGVDLWQQRFSFTFEESDSTYRQGSGNPFSGARLNFTAGRGRSVLDGMAFFKYSRDYLSGEAELRYRGKIGKSSRWRLENRFEGTSFGGDFSLKYWQNQSTLALVPRWGPLGLELRDEFGLRRYGSLDSTYASYLENKAYVTLKFYLGLASSLDLSFRNVVRHHPDFDVNDYHENRLQLSWTQSAGRHLNFSMEHELRFRNYTNAPVDYYLQDFSEYYAWGSADLSFSQRVGAEVKGTITKRLYELFSAASLPDYFSWEVEPQLYSRFGTGWRLGLGFHYERETHEDIVKHLTAVDAASALGVTFEDFYAIGPALSLEFLKVGSVVASLHESFLFRRYPRTSTRSVSDFNLYSDSNINNLLLFISWDISRNWQLSVLANADDDRSRKDSSGDSQNTLFGIEVTYSF